MRFLFSQGAVAAARRRFVICLFRAFPMQEAASAQKTWRGLLAVGPDMAELFSLETLRKASLSSVCLYLDDNMVKTIQLESVEMLYFLLR
jgi:hypothetical protein